MSDNGEEGTKTKKITHRMEIDRSPEIDSLHADLAKARQELEEKTAILEQASMEGFERKKNDLKKLYPKGGELIDMADVNTIDSVESKLKAIFPSKTIAGKSSLTSRGSSGEEEYASQTEMVDRLYNIAYYEPRKNGEKWREEHAQEIKDAKEKISTLIQSMVESPSWKEIKERGVNPIQKHKISECPKCHFTKIDTSLCGNCGYDPSVKQSLKFRDSRGNDT